MAQANRTGGSQVDLSTVDTGDYSHYFERNVPFPAGARLHGQDPARLATDKAAAYQRDLGTAGQQVNQTLEQVRANPHLEAPMRQSLVENLERNRAQLQTTGVALNQARTGYEAADTPESRKALVSTSRQSGQAIVQSGQTIENARREMDLAGQRVATQAAETAERTQRGQQVTQTLQQGTQAATSSTDPQRTLDAANAVLAMRDPVTTRPSESPYAAPHARSLGFETGSAPLTEVAGHVQTLEEQNAARRGPLLEQVGARAGELERAQPGSSRVPGSPAWEMANLKAGLEVAGEQSASTSASLARTTEAAKAGRPEGAGLHYQVSRAAEATAFEARLQGDAQRALASPAEPSSTNLNQARERLLGLQTGALHGGTGLHGRPTIEYAARTMNDVFAGRQNELRALDERLETAQATATGPAPGQPGSTQGEIRVVRTAIEQEQGRLQAARDRVMNPGSGSADAHARQAQHVAVEVAENRTLAPSDLVLTHGKTVLEGGTGVENEAVLSQIPPPRHDGMSDPNASAVWLQGRTAEARIEAARTNLGDLPAIAERMPAAAFEPGGPYFTTNVGRELNTDTPQALQNLDPALDRLETSDRISDGTMREARRAVSSGQGQLSDLATLAQRGEQMRADLGEQERIAQANPEMHAVRTQAGMLAERLADGTPDSVQGQWNSYLSLPGPDAVTPGQMREDHGNLTRYTQDMSSFVGLRETELRDIQQRAGDPRGEIRRELDSLGRAREQITMAQDSLRRAEPQIGGNGAQAATDIFSAASMLRVADGSLRNSIENVRSTPR